MKKNKIAAAFDQPADDQKNKPEADHVIPVILGVDLANRFIQGCFQDPVTGKLVNRQYTRDRFRKLLQEAKYGQMTVVMEACGTSTYWGNLCRKYGHVPVIVPAQIVHAHNTGNKDDANDARCIWQIGFMPEVKHVRLRSTDNQDMMSIMLLLDSIIETKTQLGNRIKSFLSERGVLCNKGAEAAMSTLKKFCEDAIAEEKDKNSQRSAVLSVVSSSFCGLMKAIISSEQTITDFIISWAASNEKCRLLMTIPFIGPITAAAIVIYMEDPSYFRNGRAFAAYCRMVPYHIGTGGKVEILGIHNKGNRWIKRLLYEVSQGMYHRVMMMLKKGKDAADEKMPEPLSEWIANMAARKPMKKVACAIANKLCRVSWAVLSSGTPYVQEKSSLIKPSVADPDGKVKRCRSVRKNAVKGVMDAIESLERFWADRREKAQQAA